MATKLLRRTKRKKDKKSFSSTGRQILKAIANNDYDLLRYACTLNSIQPLEALLLTCVKWIFNRPDESTIIKNDFCKWSLGRGANTSPICMAFVTEGDLIDCEQCIIDELGEVCWFPQSSYMKTIWHCKPKHFVRLLMQGFKLACKRSKRNPQSTMRKRPRRSNNVIQLPLFGVEHV